MNAHNSLVAVGKQVSGVRGAAVEIRLLGAVAAVVDGVVVDLGPARQRCVLAALAVDAGRVVSVDRLVDRVWGDQAPPQARKTLLNYLARLRRALVLAGVGDAVIRRRPGGYAVELEPPGTDLHRFRALCSRARAETGRNRARSLEEASGLWQAEALTGLAGDWAGAERDRLHRERLDAARDLTDALLELGHGEDLVPGLAVRAAEDPLDERTAGQYLLALHRAGRTADALAHYRRLRERLVADLGTDPAAALQDVHRRILAADPALAVVAEAPAPPRQLPAVPASFVGRAHELECLDAALAAPRPRGSVAVVAIAGAGGIGKTWLALHWARRRLDRFPDGQLFVDLRGFGPDEPMLPAVAVRGFLTALGVGPAAMPVDGHAQAALFRSLVAGKRMLIVLDNAADAAQAAPLLPGGASCTVLVTSRNRLPGLLTGYDARHLPLDVLSGAESRALLAAKLGAARTAAEPGVAAALAGLCGGFPLALAIVAGHAQTRPRLRLAALAADLRDHGLKALDSGDAVASLPTVLSWSHRSLTPGQVTLFALLGLAPGAGTDLPGAASLAGAPPDDTRTLLRALEQASLVEQDADGRYTMHDLVRRHAAETAETVPARSRTAALRRIVDFCLHTAHAADRLLNPHTPLVRLGPPAPGTQAHPLPDVPTALAWLDGEHPTLLAAQRIAAAHGWHAVVWQLAWTLTTYHQRRGLRHEAFAVWRAALDAAEHLPDPTARIRARRLFGHSCSRLNRHDTAVDHLQRALTEAEQHDDRVEAAHTHQVLTRVLGSRGEHRRALGHAEQALAAFRALGFPVWEAESLNAAAWCAVLTGDTDAARIRSEAALTLFRQHRAREGEASTLYSSGFIAHAGGRHRQAIHCYRQALTLLRELGSTYGAAEAADHLGQSYEALGEVEQARSAWREARTLYRELERPDAADQVDRRLAGLRSDHDGVVAAQRT